MKLSKYNKKRDFSKTKEPIGKLEKSKNKLRFCVQHHIARKDHYDFRLEYKGVLLSWAIPKGPSYNTKDKRLAVHTEDHPISYRTFEGTIPKGEYGAGTVMLFDEGTYEMIEDFSKTLKKGYLKFKLNGERLKGSWTLIKFKKDNWLLIKEKDGVKLFDKIEEFNTSIKSGKTMEEIKESLKVEITHPDKVMYKNPKTTKMDIVEFYKKVYPRMSKYLNNRLISTVRSPDGSTKNKFFKKHFKENKNLNKKRFNNEDYYYINNLKGLISEVQLNSIEFHIWGSEVNSLNYPNMMVFDLDPDKNLDIRKLRRCAEDLKKVLDNLKLKSFLKTSGGKGYHIVVPFKNRYTYKKFRNISENISKILVSENPKLYTNNIKIKNRKGKVLIDYFRNNKASTFVCPYSLRINDKPTVSMPISWSELYKIKPNQITINEAIKRLKRKDPWEGFFEAN